MHPTAATATRIGILDRIQARVTSLPNAIGGQYVTLNPPDGTGLFNAAAIDSPDATSRSLGVAFPLGFFEFVVAGPAPPRTPARSNSCCPLASRDVLPVRPHTG